ncbi:hypothetical protein BS17DRAFT_786688 [Gyrodon lividus]|nr:hypothetical protein BS17DRAFT_786688 [Gyrodon lividus]
MLTRTLLATLPFVVVAYGGPLVGRNPQCNTGPVQCCNQMKQANDAQMGNLLDLLNIPMEGTGSIGWACSPIPIAGAGSGATCQANPVCCSGNSYHVRFFFKS